MRRPEGPHIRALWASSSLITYHSNSCLHLYLFISDCRDKVEGVDVHVVVCFERQARLHLFGNLTEMMLVDGIEVAVELWMDDEIQSKLFVAEDSFLQGPFDFYRDAFVRLHEAIATAIGTLGEDRLDQRAAVPLSGHLDQAEFAHPQDRAFGCVVLHAVSQTV